MHSYSQMETSKRSPFNQNPVHKYTSGHILLRRGSMLYTRGWASWIWQGMLSRTASRMHQDDLPGNEEMREDSGNGEKCKDTQQHKNTATISFCLCAWVPSELAGWCPVPWELLSEACVYLPLAMDEWVFCNNMKLIEGEPLLPNPWGKILSFLDGPIIPSPANGCSKLTSQKLSVLLCEKVKVSLCEPHYHSNWSFVSCFSLQRCASPWRDL